MRLFDLLLGAVRTVAHQVRLWKRFRHRAALQRRWDSRTARVLKQVPSSVTKNTFDRVTTRVINLEIRKDRLQQVQRNFESVGIRQWHVVTGFDGKRILQGVDNLLAGSIGCELSHISAVSAGILSDSEAIMVCEDDLEFVGTAGEIEAVIEEFLSNPSLDVLLLAGRPRGGSIRISDNLRVVIGAVGRGCYVMKPHMGAPLTRAFSGGLRKLDRGSLRGKGDLEWRELQAKGYFFASPVRDLARQSQGYSDIESKYLGPR